MLFDRSFERYIWWREVLTRNVNIGDLSKSKKNIIHLKRHIMIGMVFEVKVVKGLQFD